MTPLLSGMKKIQAVLILSFAIMFSTFLLVGSVSAHTSVSNKGWSTPTWGACQPITQICAGTEGTQSATVSCVQSTGSNVSCSLGTLVPATYLYADKVVQTEGHYTCSAGYSIDPQHSNKCIKTVTKYADKHDGHCPTNDSSYTSTTVKACSREITDTKNATFVETTYMCPSGYENNPEHGDEHKDCRKVADAEHYTNPETKIISQSCTLLAPDYSACTPAGTCPVPACGQSETTVPDGHGGLTVCPATEACPVPVNGGWSVLGSCPTAPGSPAVVLTSTCTNPVPLNGGTPCVGSAPTVSCPAIPLQCTPNTDQIFVSDTSTNVTEIDTITQNTPSVVVTPTSITNTFWTASIPGATWIWSEEPITGWTADKAVTFTKTFTVTDIPTGGSITIAADNTYEITLNGHLIDADSSGTLNTFQNAATHPILATDLVTGTNTLVIVVKNIGQA
jgi:hypothetical protein